MIIKLLLVGAFGFIVGSFFGIILASLMAANSKVAEKPIKHFGGYIECPNCGRLIEKDWEEEE